MRFSIYNNTRTIDIFDRIVKDYETTTGDRLTSDIIEDIIRVNFLNDYIQYISDKDLACIVEKHMCTEAYIPFVPITLYGNRHINIPILYAEPYVHYQGLTPKNLEILIHLSKYYKQLSTLSDKELEDAVVELIGEELEATMVLPEIIAKNSNRQCETHT